MNAIKYVSILLFCIVCNSCEKVQIPDAPSFDLTEIVAFKAYDVNKADIATDNPLIDIEGGMIIVSVKDEVDLKSIFATCGLSSGATISPAMDKYDDWSTQSKSFIVTSASGKRSQQWTITLKK